MVFVFGGAYAGKEKYVRANFGADVRIIRDIHLIIKNAMQDGKNPYEEIERLAEDNPNAVFISNEIGCGIVPADKLERDWREAAGRINCYLTEKADTVIRVVCGIGIRVK